MGHRMVGAVNYGPPLALGGACLMAKLCVCVLEASNVASIVWSPFLGWSVRGLLCHRKALSCWVDDLLSDG